MQCDRVCTRAQIARNHLVPINTYLGDFIAIQSHIKRLRLVCIKKYLKKAILFFLLLLSSIISVILDVKIFNNLFSNCFH